MRNARPVRRELAGEDGTALVVRPPGPDDADALAEVDEQVRGFVVAGPARDAGSAAVGEVIALNVHPATWGQGLGSALLHAAKTGLSTAGFTTAMLWVVSDNVRARGFSAHHGWRDDNDPVAGGTGQQHAGQQARPQRDQLRDAAWRLRDSIAARDAPSVAPSRDLGCALPTTDERLARAVPDLAISHAE